MFHFDDPFEKVFWWRVISAWPALNKVTKSSCFLECREFMNILLHVLLQILTSKVTDNMFQESIVQKVPIKIQFGPDVHKSYWLRNVCQLFLNKASMLSAS